MDLLTYNGGTPMGKTKILILEANRDEDLRLNDEMRDVQNVIRQSQAREEFEIAFEPSVKSTKLQQLMSDHKPNIVHFCGHGAGQDGLVFRDVNIDAGNLSHIFKSCQHYLQCVVLNSCYSEVQANEIVKYIPYVIGINKEIRDDAAIAFSIGFYQALGYGQSFKHAYKCGCKAIEILQISNGSIDRDAIAKEMRKLVPINDVLEANITPEYLKPVFKKKPLIPSDQSRKLEDHYNDLIKAITRGWIIPFLGSDINLCDRSIQGNGELERWEPDCLYPPSGKELAAYFATTFPPQAEPIVCPLCNQENLQKTETKPGELPGECPLMNRVIHEHALLICPLSKQSLNVGGETLQYLSQQVDITNQAEFYERLQRLVLGCQPNQLHKFFATLLAMMRKKRYYPPYPLIVTSNYDCALERAFEEAGEPFDLVFYSNAINAQQKDRFVHRKPDGSFHEIDNPNQYQDLSFKEQPVILKLYGSVDQIERGKSLVITEENYIEYFVSRNLSNLLPVELLKKINFPKPDILFLGYPLDNWNQRIILHRIWENLNSTKNGWWSIQSKSESFARRLWDSYAVAHYDVPLRDYIIELEQRMRDIPPKGDQGSQ